MATRPEGPTELRLPAGATPSPDDLGASGDMPVLAVAGTTTDVAADLAVRLLPTLRAVVDLAAAREIALVTGGTDAGVFHLLGLALSTAPRRPPLIVGVAPDELVAEPGDQPSEGRAAADATLDVLVRVPGRRWGDETAALSRIVGRLAGAQPSALLLVGGGEVSRAELVEHLARGRPVVALTGSGRLADALGEGLARRGGQAPGDDLPALLASGDVATAPIDRPRVVCRRLARVLGRRRRRRRRSAVRSVLPRVRYRPEPPPVPVSSAQAREWPLLLDRVAEAEAVVYPAFAQCDVEARLEQNRHRWFTVLALAGSFLTTVFGALQAWLQSAVWPGVVVATLGGASSMLTTVARRQGALRSFLDARTRAERLRSLYFAHLARSPATDHDAAARERHHLERAVAALAWGTGVDPEPPASDRPVGTATGPPVGEPASLAALAAAGAPPAGGPPAAVTGAGSRSAYGPAADGGGRGAGGPAGEWYREFLAAYRRHRVEDQSGWYADRARQFERARRTVVALSAVLMVLAALFGALGAADAGGRGAWAFLAASMAALATALTSFEAAVGLERYGRLYGEAHRALMVAAADAPIDPDLAVDGDTRVLDHVQRIERILGDEVDTWSRYARQPADSEDGGRPAP
ncbi:MAG TPA: SLATT domain-containing protein [Acidimicrobiales bacterium]|nr:SLATT domain-containing protein [Acidimicrobiales bacterium]